MNKDRTIYWSELAEYDLETARAMFKTKRYLYVGFMCHQVIEKILKGYYTATSDDNPPYTHNLTLLASKSGIFESLSEEQKDFISAIQPLNIETRYPETKEKLFRLLTEDKCKTILSETEALFLWIKEKF